MFLDVLRFLKNRKVYSLLNSCVIHLIVYFLHINDFSDKLKNKFNLSIKLFIISIILQVFNFNLFAQYKLIQKDIQVIDNSNIYSEFVILDTLNDKIVNLNKSNINILENNSELLFNYEHQTTNLKPLNVFFVIPTTSLVTDFEFESILTSIKSTLPLLDYNTKFGISSYNSKHFIINSLNSDKNIITQGIDKIQKVGGNNFNSVFNIEPFKIFDYLPSDENSIILFINKGNSEIDELATINNAISKNIKIYSIDLDKEFNSNLNNISISTGGKYLNEINSFETLNLSFYDIILNNLGVKFNKISWSTKNCEKIKNYNFNFINNNFNFQNAKTIELNNFSYNFSLVPSNEIKYNNIKLNQTYIQSIKLNNNYSKNVIIEKIEISSTRLNIKNLKLRDEVTNNSSKNLEIEYTAIDTNYFYGYINIFTNLCDKITIIVTAGNIENIKNTTFKITTQNDNENYFAGERVNIKWEGISNTDTLSLFHSTNNGKSWENISNTATNNLFTWTIPDKYGNQNLIKAIKYTNTDLLEGVNYINQINPNRHCSQLEWNYDGSILATANTDESILLWDPYKEKYLNLVYDEFFNVIYDIKWSPVRNYLATSVESNISGNDVIIFDIDEDMNIIRLKGNSTKPQCLSWSKDGRFLAAGLLDGKINIWQITKDATPVITIDEHFSKVSKIAFNPVFNWLISSDDFGRIIIKDLDNKVPNLVTAIVGKVTGMVWSPDGNEILLSGESPNFESYKVEIIDNLFRFQKVLDIRRQNHPKYNHNINGIDWSKDGTLLISFADKYIQVWDAKKSNLIYTYTGHQTNIKDAKINLQNNIASTGSNNVIQNWNLNKLPHTQKELLVDTTNLFNIYKFSLNFKNIVFDTTCVGVYIPQVIPNFLTNNSPINLTIDSLKIVGVNKDEFNIISLSKNILSSGESANLFIGFLPKDTFIKNAQIEIYIRGIKTVVDILGYTKSTEFKFNNDFIIFDDTPILEKSTQILRIYNQGNKIETITNLDFTSLNNSFRPKFIYNNSVIEPNEFLDIEIDFVPKNSEIVGGILQINTLSDCTPYIITLKGKGVEGEISIENTNNYLFNSCSNKFIDTFFTIKNIGKGNLIIKEVNKIGDIRNEITLLDDFISNNLVIKPNTSQEIKFRYEPKSFNKSNLTFQIYTNILKNGNTKTDLELELIKFDSKLEPIEVNLDFTDIKPNNKLIKQFKFLYNGNHSIQLEEIYNFDNFVFKNFNKSVLSDNDTLIFDVEFLGLTKDSIFTQNINLSYDCKNIYNFTFNILVNSGGSFLSFPNSIAFNEQNCKSAISEKLKLKNLTLKPIDIKSIELNNIPSEYYFNDDYLNISLNKDDEIEITIIKDVLIDGIFNDTLIIQTNADNVFSGILKIPISLEVKLLDYQFEKNNLEFISNNNLEKITNTLTFRNNGQKEIIWDFPQTINPYFVLDSVSPKVTIVNSESTLFFSFKPKTISDEIKDVFVFTDNCGRKTEINLSGKVLSKNYVNLNLQNLLTNVGSTIELPITLRNPENIELNSSDSLVLTISYNPTILHLLSQSENEIHSNIIKNSRRFITQKIFIEDLKLQDNINQIKTLKFITSLGDTSFTDIIVEEAYFQKNQVKILAENSKVELLDICYINGNGRFVKDNGVFGIIKNYPNPILDELNIEFNLIESGQTELKLYDINGRKLQTLLNENLESGKYLFKFNLNYLESDIYYIKLQTETLFNIVKVIKYR